MLYITCNHSIIETSGMPSQIAIVMVVIRNFDVKDTGGDTTDKLIHNLQPGYVGVSDTRDSCSYKTSSNSGIIIHDPFLFQPLMHWNLA